MELNTARLIIAALSPAQLALWTEDLPRLEAELACVYRAEPLTGAFKEIVRGQLARVEADPDNYLWRGFWLLIRRADRVVVGAADFKDAPNAAGEVEIGYGLGDGFGHCGFMTEAVRALCCWALTQPGVRTVLAETDRDNKASQRVLERSGFSVRAQTDTLWWQLTKNV